LDKIKLGIIIYGIAVFAILVVWRTWIFWKKTGVWPITLTTTDSVRSFTLMGAKTSIFLAFVTVVIYTGFPNLYRYLVPIPYLEDIRLKLAGFGLLTFAIVWAAIAQSHMQKSFRIGIPENAKTDLVTTGLFRISRNPIYLGMMVCILGFFFIVPNALSLTVSCLIYVFISMQIRLEEEWLKSHHGEAFTKYMSQVRRWI
jgi:protein-S-isoprenylcysteine O-methyltransferase Ste14